MIFQSNQRRVFSAHSGKSANLLKKDNGGFGTPYQIRRRRRNCMGEVNNYMCEYLGLAQYNADFWNGTVFHGKRRVKIWQLSRHDREYYKTQYKRKKTGSVRKDVQMLCKGKKDIILAIEVIATVDYSIPVRVMDYDVQELRRQIKDIGQKHSRLTKELGKRAKKDYINDLQKEDRLIPIHTVVLYCGEERFQQLDEISAKFMGALIGIRKLNMIQQEEGGVDMCKAFEQVMEEGRKEGRKEGRMEGRREGRNV